MKQKEFVWEIDGYSGSVYAFDYEEAREKLDSLMCLQEVEEDEN